MARRPTLTEVFEQHAAFVLRVVRRLGVGNADVEDAAQEVFLVLHRRLGDFDPARPLRPWIYGIARRVVSEMRRKRQRSAHMTAPEAPPVPSPEQSLEIAEARRLLDEALDTLSEDARFVFVGYELEGMSMKEISEASGAPLQTCYSRLRAARERILAFAHGRRSS